MKKMEIDLGDNAAGVNIHNILRIGDAAAAILCHASNHDDGKSDPIVPRHLMDELGNALDSLTDFVNLVTALMVKHNASQVRN